MRRLFIAIVAAAALVVAIYYGVGASLPAEVSVLRTRRIEASPERIYEWVGHVDRWPEWTVWNPADVPGLAIEFPAARDGAGATQLWRHPDGDGRLEITAAEAGRGVSYELSFEGSALAMEGFISFAAAGSATDVSWQVRGALGSRRERWFGLTLAPRIGNDLERSLERLAERVAPPRAAPESAPGG